MVRTHLGLGTHLDFSLPMKVRRAKLDRLSGQELVKYSQLATDPAYRDWRRIFIGASGVSVSTIHESLRRYDLNHVDSVDDLSFIHALRKAGVQIGTDRLRALFSDLDVRSSGRVDIEMFCSLVNHWRTQPNRTTPPQARIDAPRSSFASIRAGQSAFDLGEAIGSFELQETLRMLLERRGEFLKACAQLASVPQDEPMPRWDDETLTLSTVEFWLAARHVGVASMLGIGPAMERFAMRVGAIEEAPRGGHEHGSSRTQHTSGGTSSYINPSRLLNAAFELFCSCPAVDASSLGPGASQERQNVSERGHGVSRDMQENVPPSVPSSLPPAPLLPPGAGPEVAMRDSSLMAHAARVWNEACRHLSRSTQRWDVLLAQSLSMRDLISALASAGLKLRDQDQHAMWKELHATVYATDYATYRGEDFGLVQTIPTAKSPLPFGKIDKVLRNFMKVKRGSIQTHDENIAIQSNRSTAGVTDNYGSYDPYKQAPSSFLFSCGDNSKTAAGERTKVRQTHLRAGAIAGERQRKTSPFAVNGTFDADPDNSFNGNTSGNLYIDPQPNIPAGAYPRRGEEQPRQNSNTTHEHKMHDDATFRQPMMTSEAVESSSVVPSPPRKLPPFAVSTEAKTFHSASQSVSFQQPATKVGRGVVPNRANAPEGVFSYQRQHHGHEKPLWEHGEIDHGREMSLLGDCTQDSNRVVEGKGFIAGSPSHKLARAMGDKYGYTFPDRVDTGIDSKLDLEAHENIRSQGIERQHPLETAPQSFHDVSYPWPPPHGYPRLPDNRKAENSHGEQLPPAGIPSPPRRFPDNSAINETPGNNGTDPLAGSPELDLERMPPIVRRLRAIMRSRPTVREELNSIFPEVRSAFRYVGMSRGEVQQGLQV